MASPVFSSPAPAHPTGRPRWVKKWYGDRCVAFFQLRVADEGRELWGPQRFRVDPWQCTDGKLTFRDRFISIFLTTLFMSAIPGHCRVNQETVVGNGKCRLLKWVKGMLFVQHRFSTNEEVTWNSRFVTMEQLTTSAQYLRSSSSSVCAQLNVLDLSDAVMRDESTHPESTHP